MLTSEQYNCGTHEKARAVADQLVDDGWIDVASRGQIVYFATDSNNPGARGFVAAVAAMISTRGAL